jgi:iron(III) transport system substrate-binding protein
MNMLTFGPFGRALLLSAATLLAVPALAQDSLVNVYSYRQPDLIQPLLDAFTAETGIETQVIFLDKGLEERIQAEGANSPADVIFTVDISRLANAKELGITQPVDNATIEANVPEQYRDPEDHWFGLTTRARVIYASKERVPETAITYEELADPKWKGRLCMRSGQHVYNLGLIASMIAHNGAAETETWLEGVKANLVEAPTGGDRDQAKLIHAGGCDIGLGNTYYVGLMQTNEKEPEQKEWANSIKVLFPNAEDRGTQVNISGMALAKNAPNRENAVKLMEFLASDKAQQLYAEANFEYPVKAGVPVSEVTQSFGELKPDTLPIAEMAKHRKEASEMVDRVGLDAGPSS